MKDTRRRNKENTTDYCGGQRVRTLQQTVAAVDVGYGYGGRSDDKFNVKSKTSNEFLCCVSNLKLFLDRHWCLPIDYFLYLSWELKMQRNQHYVFI